MLEVSDFAINYRFDLVVWNNPENEQYSQIINI